MFIQQSAVFFLNWAWPYRPRDIFRQDNSTAVLATTTHDNSILFVNQPMFTPHFSSVLHFYATQTICTGSAVCQEPIWTMWNVFIKINYLSLIIKNLSVLFDFLARGQALNIVSMSSCFFIIFFQAKRMPGDRFQMLCTKCNNMKAFNASGYISVCIHKKFEEKVGGLHKDLEGEALTGID